ncbi:acid-sensing ion channel 1-like isoform X1 [Brachionus plicatilis]|uniref:Acid-sensing ion channel 1-like isoform X1 n=1 Tax=Brachionus plicatilis TaxID=10195 RepID=A0A3M7SXW6_BRAPC|nr:acid-sensing ion channel 1-like isoform X1 [Brachionus plicatilis]
MNKKNNLYLERIKELAESSSIHGIPNAVRTKSLVIRIFWILVFFGFFAYSMLSVVKLIIKYLEYNVVVKMERAQPELLEFPAVTFCNINPYDYTIEENYKIASDYLNESFLSNDTNLKTCNRKTRNQLRYGISNLEGFELEKMLISCEYDRKPCNLQNIVSQDPDFFGNCFTFNFGKDADGKSIPIEEAKQPGLLNGLQIQLFIGPREYQPCWEEKYGAVVVVHNQTSLPLYLEEGIFVPTGFETNLVLKKNIINKLSTPNIKCVKNVSDKAEVDTVYFRNTIEACGSYNQKWCARNCSLDKINQENTIKCSNLNLTTLFEKNACLKNFDNITKYYDFCISQCPIECEYSFYSIDKNAAGFPSYRQNQQLLFDESFRSKFPNGTVSLEQVKDSVLSFNVFFSEKAYMRIEEIRELSFGSLLGNLGGQFGLFLGLSFLTFVEIFEILFEIVMIFLSNRIKTKLVKKSKPSFAEKV